MNPLIIIRNGLLKMLRYTFLLLFISPTVQAKRSFVVLVKAGVDEIEGRSRSAADLFIYFLIQLIKFPTGLQSRILKSHEPSLPDCATPS